MSQYILVSIDHDTIAKLRHSFVLCPIKTIYCEGNTIQEVLDAIYLECRKMVLEYQDKNSGPFIPASTLRLFESHLSEMGNKRFHELYTQGKIGFMDEDPLTSFPLDYKTYREGHSLVATNDNINIYRCAGIFASPDKATVH